MNIIWGLYTRARWRKPVPVSYADKIKRRAINNTNRWKTVHEFDNI